MFDHVWGNVFRDLDITRGLSTFDRPVLLALGRYDFIVAPPCSWDPIRPKFRDLTVRVFEHSGHNPRSRSRGCSMQNCSAGWPRR